MKREKLIIAMGFLGIIALGMMLFMTLAHRPGGLLNPHDWLSAYPNPNALGEVDHPIGASFLVLMKPTPPWIFMRIDLPKEKRVVNLDLCLKHGEIRVLP